MRCPHCGKENQPEAVRCAYCGTRLTEQAVPDLREDASFADAPASLRRDAAAKNRRRRKARGPGGAVAALFIVTGILLLAVLGTGGYLLGQRLGLFATAAVPAPAEATPVPSPTPAPSASPVPAETPSPEPTESLQPSEAPAPRSIDLEGSASWPELYPDFITEKRYLASSVPPYFDTADPGIRFALRDMDGNGTPELIACNGADSLAEAAAYVYTCEGDGILFLGEAGRRELEFYGYDDGRYPGIFCTDGNGDVFTTCYYRLEDGSVTEEEVLEDDYSGLMEEDAEVQSRQLTDDGDLFELVTESAATDRTYLTFYSREEILSMGWNGFMLLCGLGE